MHGTYLKKTLQILTYVFDWIYFTQYLTSFLFSSRSSSLSTVFDSISSNIDVLINPSADVLILGDFNIIIRTGLPILVELIDLVNSIKIFLSQMTLLR